MSAQVEAKAAKANRSVLISRVSNVSVQYNFQVIAIVLALMDNTKSDPRAMAAAYPRTDAETAIIKGVVFAGAICGQVIMGYSGDKYGRRKTMMLTNFLTFLGAIGSALFTFGTPTQVYSVMAVFRFLLGVGVGGKYPLAATMMSEGAGGTPQERSLEVAKSFCWQTPGAMLPYLVGIFILLGFGKDNHGAAHMTATDAQFRLLLGMGALPAAYVMFLAYHEQESSQFLAEQKVRGAGETRMRVRTNPCLAACRNRELLRQLVGTGVGWFIYDVLLYGVVSTQPEIMDKIFTGQDLFSNACE